MMIQNTSGTNSIIENQMYKFQECDTNYEECPEVTTVDVVDTEPTEPVVPMLMKAWILVPVLDLAAGVYNYVTYSDTAYSQDFELLTYLDLLAGVVGLASYVTGAVMGSPLFLINICSKTHIAHELAAIYLEMEAIGETVTNTESGTLVYGMHSVALAVAGAAVMPIASYISDSKAWDEAHAEEVVDEPTEDTVDDYGTEL